MKLRKRGFVGSVSNEVTERETENRKKARQAATEGFVLLKNEDHVLPLEKGCKIGLYGAGAIRTIKGGTGSGDVNERDCVNIYQGMKNAGYEITSKDWLESYDKLFVQARLDWKEEIYKKMPEYGNNFFCAYSATQFQMPCGDPINVKVAKADGADTAIFVLSRIAGENADRQAAEGDYFITAQEKALLTQISEAYKNVILVINTGGLVDLGFTEEFTNIRSILQFMQAGQEGGNAFADVISGDVTPSGKMTDTWALSYEDYPNASFFSYMSGNVNTEEYKEGLYVGYRYFDTFDVPVRYCFGYGLSYTEFQMQADRIQINGISTSKPKVSIDVEIKNIGDTYAGKEVAQIYVSCPQGKLPKEYRRLAGFGKTAVLKPGETQKLRISFDLYQLASYSEELAAWILEKGAYGIWVGNSLDSAELVGTLKLDEDAVMVQCEHICEKKQEMDEIHPDPEKVMAKEAAWLKKADKLPAVELKAAEIVSEKISYSHIPDKLLGKAGEITESLSLDQLVAFATGDVNSGQSELGSAGQTVPGAAAETVSVAATDPWNVASIVLADGPAGIRLKQSYQVFEGKIEAGDILEALEGGFFARDREKRGTTYHQYCTAIPVGTLLAQTWNVDLIKEIGEMIGHEMELFEVTLWLAPGMNIHRNPLCGRNFEYYSEDPLLSGMIASAMTLGVQKVPGCGTTIKHFACNNQEDNRLGSDSVLSERTLREIYLKGFEICVKNSQPMSIMTSYNMINGVHAANCYDICTKAARDEWGFAGAIMTDWTTTTESTAGECTASGCMQAGNDMVMPGALSDHENIRKALKEGTLDIRELKRCVCNTIRIALASNQYEDAVSYLEQFENLDSYMTVETL
ncbi:MAG: glycoside hydrolase family 3 C-terminal domain-containing protein [Blautia sp.]|nr:glycoside hydrolase family 3 C-terminal domain-containing protein [Blautia sp.]